MRYRAFGLRSAGTISILAYAGALMSSVPVQGGIMSFPDLLNRPQPQPDHTLSYGSDAHQVVDLWMPAGKVRHPTVIMLHGGCWQTKVADRKIMNWVAADLRSRGIAVWNIDYRGVDLPGGGYPGTFQDVATATEMLRTFAPQYRLSTDHLVAVGHSAGGHLAMWLAARMGLPRSSALQTAHPIKIDTVVSLGGLPDLAAAAAPPPGSCRASSALQLVGPPTPSHPDIFADTSPAAMPVWKARTVLINGKLDTIAPPSFATDFADKMQRKGKRMAVLTVGDSGHVELIAPDTTAWQLAVSVISKNLQPARSRRRTSH